MSKTRGKEPVLSAILAAQNEGDFTQLEELVQRHLTRGDDFSMQDVLDLMTSVEHEDLWAVLHEFVKLLLSALRIDDEDEVEGDGMVEGAEDIVQSLRRVASMLSLYVESQHRPPSLLTVLELVHDTLIPLSDEIPGANVFKTAVARCCEAWWIKEEAGAENVVTQLIPYNLLTALGPSVPDADVKRCWSIRGALLLLDFDDSSIESIRGLLLRCVVHPSFLKVAEGRRFLSFLFTIKQNLVPTLVSVMKPNIASGIKHVASAYGEVLYRAWKDSERTPSIQEAIEDCIQRLGHETILASDRKYFRGLRILLGAFHENKRVKGVDSMLLKAYGPILWRSLRCANALVRAQATMLFFDAFPLQDTEAGLVETDSVLQKQFDLLSSLVKDEDHRVRAAAVSGVFHILGEYWEALPLTTTRQILSYVVGTLGQDSSCVDVRLAMVEGIHELLDQPLAHGLLAGLLPLLKNSIHDNAEKVRVAFVKVLDKVKGINGIHFYDIVPQDNLLAQFAEDSSRPTTALAFTKLLLNSFYPREENGSSSTQMNIEQKVRCVKFVRMNADAAVAFYSSLHKFVSVGSVSKLCSMLFVMLSQPVVTQAPTTAEPQQPEEPKHPLAARAKRRREHEVARRQVVSGSGVSGDAASVVDDANPAHQSSVGVFDFQTRVGVLRVIFACFSSITSMLKQDKHEPSREFISKHINAAAILEVFKAVEPSEVNPDVESLPLLLQLIALVNDVRAVDDAKSAEASAGATPQELSFDNVMGSYARAWGSINSDETLDDPTREKRLRQQAAACVEVVSTLGEVDGLIEAMRSSFEAVGPVTSSRKKQHKSTNVSASAAVDLLDAVVNSPEQRASHALRIRVLNDYTVTGAGTSKPSDLVTVVMSYVQSAALNMDFSVLSPTEILRCIHLQATAAVAKIAIDSNADVGPFNKLSDWMTERVIPGICGAEPTAANDLITPNLSPSLIMETAERWMTALVTGENHILPVLVPVVGRWCSITKPTSRLFALSWELLVKNLSASDETTELCPSKKLVTMHLAGNKDAVILAVDLLIKSIKKWGAVDKITWGVGDSWAPQLLTLIQQSPHVCDACLHLAAALERGEGDRGHTRLISDLFHNSKPVVQTELKTKLNLDSLKENRWSAALLAALQSAKASV